MKKFKKVANFIFIQVTIIYDQRRYQKNTE